MRVLNIGPAFHQGMELVPGSYHVETSKQGYKTQEKWVDLKAGENKRLEVRLEQLQASIQPTSTYTRPSSNSDVVQRDGIYVAYANGINWTLSDKKVRAHVTMGVTYGSPVREVERLMLKAAEGHEKVRKKPEPFILFNDFGDNALIFDVYFWLSMTRIMERRIIESDIRIYHRASVSL